MSYLGYQNPNEGSYIGRLVVEASGLIQRACLRDMPHGNPSQGGNGLNGLCGLTFHLDSPNPSFIHYFILGMLGAFA